MPKVTDAGLDSMGRPDGRSFKIGCLLDDLKILSDVYRVSS